MALRGVMRPGHAEIRVLDMNEATNFYGNVLGLIETGRDSVGRVYYRASKPAETVSDGSITGHGTSATTTA